MFRFCKGYGLPLVVIPSPGVVYNCLLTGSAMNVSRICGILARCAAHTHKALILAAARAVSLPRLIFFFPLCSARTEYQHWQTVTAADADPVVPTPRSVENLEHFNGYDALCGWWWPWFCPLQAERTSNRAHFKPSALQAER